MDRIWIKKRCLKLWRETSTKQRRTGPFHSETDNPQQNTWFLNLWTEHTTSQQKIFDILNRKPITKQIVFVWNSEPKTHYKTNGSWNSGPKTITNKTPEGRSPGLRFFPCLFLLFFLFSGAQNVFFFGLTCFTISFNLFLNLLIFLSRARKYIPLRPLFLFSHFSCFLFFFSFSQFFVFFLKHIFFFFSLLF